MSLEQPQTIREWIEVWQVLHADVWRQYANSEVNEALLRRGAEKYGRPSQTAVDRSFNDVRDLLVPTSCAADETARRTAPASPAAQ